MTYFPHATCWLHDPAITGMEVGSHLVIWLAYMVIAALLLNSVWDRPTVPLRGLRLLFAAFIFTCGVTHFFGALTAWWPIYVAESTVLMATGLISVLSAVVTWRAMPLLTAQDDYWTDTDDGRERIAKLRAALEQVHD